MELGFCIVSEEFDYKLKRCFGLQKYIIRDFMIKAYLIKKNWKGPHTPLTHLPVSSIAPHFNITLVTRLIYLLARIENASRGD